MAGLESDLAETSTQGESKNLEKASETDDCTTGAKEADASNQKAGSRTAAAAGLERVLCSPIKKMKTQSSMSNILNEESKTP